MGAVLSSLSDGKKSRKTQVLDVGAGSGILFLGDAAGDCSRIIEGVYMCILYIYYVYSIIYNYASTFFQACCYSFLKIEHDAKAFLDFFTFALPHNAAPQ